MNRIIKEKIEKAIEEFNKYRVPEAKARVISFEEGFSIEFTGSFCETSGFYDHFNDHRIILENDMKNKTEIKEILEMSKGAIEKFHFSK